MKCIKCGEELGEGDVFCHKCGSPVQRTNENNNEIKNEVKNENMYTYERPAEQQVNYNQQQVNGQNHGQPNNYGNPNQQNYGQQYNNKGNENVIRICIIVVISIAVLAAVAFFVHSLVSAINKNDKGNKNPVSITSNDTGTASTKDDNSGSVTSLSNTQKSSAYKVNCAGFKFYIPDNLIYEVDTYSDAITIGDAEQTWVVQAKIQEGSFEQIKQNKNYVKSYATEGLAEYGVTVSDVKTEKIDGVEYILLELSMGGRNEILGFAGLNSMYAIVFEMANEDNDFSIDNLKDLSTIISTAEYTGETKNLEANKKIKTTDLEKILEKATKQN